MRLKHSLALARMLMIFFSRRVLRMGILRSPTVRVLGAVLVGLILVVLCATAYSFLGSLVDTEAMWRLLFDLTTISLVLWVQIAFLFVKMLFLNAEGVLALSFQLPVTNRERATAFMMYEASMTAVVVAAGSVSLVVSSMLLLGPGAVLMALTSVMLPVVLTYLTLSVLYLLLTRLCGLLGIRPIENILLVLGLFGLVVVYLTQMPSSVLTVSQAYLDKTDTFLWITGLAWFARRYGEIPSLGVGIALAVILLALALSLTPNQHVRQSRYLNVPVGRWLRRILGPYDWCVIRNSQTITGAAIAVALFGYLMLDKALHPLWGLAVLSIGGLYQFAATEPLRMLDRGTCSPWRIYSRLLRAQLVLLGLFAVPCLAIIGVVSPSDLAGSALPLLGCVGGATLSIGIGIVFPSEKDNPFSVFIGLSATAVVLTLAAIGIGLLQLSPPAVYAFFTGASALFVLYSVQGIRTTESRRRHAQGHSGHQFHTRRRALDGRNGSDHPALPHVLRGE